ncbi:hypothetical protein ABEB36_003160 [Hypothenemus hampei]|uniref:Kaptin n=1 Tax=Hypothenemus hampei TaxID=57062 RepID=A0ABD1FAV8_HYPHA
MEQLKDAHYFHMPFQGNIYTMTELRLSNGKVPILAASLKRDIFYFEYLESSPTLEPATKEISFTYIPSGAEIISIDAFNKSSVINVAVIGITIIKNSNDSDSLETFLNIYSQLEEDEDFNIENIAQNCLTLELNFIPYHLTHTELITWDKDYNFNKKEIVFVLSGSDHQIHIYRENPMEHIYKEIDSYEFFPEFTKTPSPIVWIDILYMNNYEERITAIGCECGYLKLIKVDTKVKKTVYNFSTRFTNYIAKVNLYIENETKHLENFNKGTLKICCEKREISRPILNLVVVNSILPSVLFQCFLVMFSNLASVTIFH